MEEQFRCLKCGKTKKADSKNYFKSYDKNNAIGIIPYCKECLDLMVKDEGGIINESKLKETLKLINRPFIKRIWDTSKNEEGNSFGTYMKNLGLRQYRELTWLDSDLENDNITIPENIINKINDENYDLEKLKEKWGTAYSLEELVAFEKKYNFLKNNYQEKTNMHIEALQNYVRYRVKEEIATAEGNVKDAKEWGALADKAATSAKINPSQLSKADLSDGLTTFSELSQAVEKEVDIIPILPRFKCRPNDALDFNIWCYVNYLRDLQGLPPCKYEDVYAFYDKRKQDYIKQYGDPYGIFTDDTSSKNRENIKKFIIEEDGDN